MSTDFEIDASLAPSSSDGTVVKPPSTDHLWNTSFNEVSPAEISAIVRADKLGTRPSHDLELSSPPPAEAGEGGEGGAPALAPAATDPALTVSNAEFITAVFGELPADATPAVCSKNGNPEGGAWPAQATSDIDKQCPATKNNYLVGSLFKPAEDGAVNVKKESLVSCHAIMLDDLGTKVPMEKLGSFKLSWLIKTSPDNHQGGIIFKGPISGPEADALHKAIIANGLCDKGASGPATRWFRLPNGINGKAKYQKDGAPFQCCLVNWNPEARYTPEEIVSQLGLTIASSTSAKVSSPKAATTKVPYEVFSPAEAVNPVITALKSRGLYKSELGGGKHDITCPWVGDHTDALDTGAAYFEPSDEYTYGGFCCQHSHRDEYRLSHLLEYLGLTTAQARNQSVIRVVPSEISPVVDAAERELAKQGRHYQSGGLIVSLATSHESGDQIIVPTNVNALTRELSKVAAWEKFDGRKKGYVPIDPPHRHVSILFDEQNYTHLPVLNGLARQPYFRESDGALIKTAGYDAESRLFGVFDPSKYDLPEPTKAAAEDALAMLLNLLSEFHFVSPEDKSAALGAMFTAVLRPSLEKAPAFHVQAPVFGSGKSYLCEVISAFAGPGSSQKVSYPKTSEEATKVILSLLMAGPSVIEFDDMDTDWIPHGVIKRMMTTDSITDRILGVSKTATVSTRVLFLGSGNNVGPTRDLLRRIVPIHLDPRCATPAMLSYQQNPTALVRADREAYVAAVLTIIQAWRHAGAPKATIPTIASYNGAWSTLVRHPLIWLGQRDPAAGLVGQIQHDPDAEALACLMQEWYAAFGSNPTTVRKACEFARRDSQQDLLDAISHFPVVERGEINHSKFGWLLKKNANRIASGYEIQAASADGRNGWRVVTVQTDQKPPQEAIPAFQEQFIDL